MNSLAKEFTSIYRMKINHVYSCQFIKKCSFKGFAVVATKESISKLSQDSRVERVASDSVSSPLGDIRQSSDQTEDKFRRTTNAKALSYIAYLKDELPDSKIAEIANQLVKIYGGKLLRTYRRPAKSFLFQTTETQAIALSQNEQIKFVETSIKKSSRD